MSSRNIQTQIETQKSKEERERRCHGFSIFLLVKAYLLIVTSINKNYILEILLKPNIKYYIFGLYYCLLISGGQFLMKNGAILQGPVERVSISLSCWLDISLSSFFPPFFGSKDSANWMQAGSFGSTLDLHPIITLCNGSCQHK